MLQKLIFKIGARFRNPRLFSYINKLIISDFENRDNLKKMQLERLNKLLVHAISTSAYYANCLKGPVNSLEDLAHMPTLDKPTLLNNVKRIQSNKRFKKLLLSETSGTSGQALKFYKNIEWDTINRASWMRSYTWYNVNPWERNGYFWGYNFSKKAAIKTKILDLLQNRFRLFSYDDESIEKFVRKLKRAKYLHGYSSMIYEVAEKAKAMGFSPSDFPELKMIKGTSEKIFPKYQSVVQEVFGKKIISEYGAAETGIIAFECPGGYMHVNEENVIVEEIDGEIVVTNLNSFSFPIIRYKLGDAIKLAPSSVCSCGRQSDIILEVEGRVGKKIIGISKSYPSLTLYYVFKNLALKHNLELQYQAYQKSKGALELRIPTKLSEKEEALLLAETARYFENDINIALKQEYSIHSKKGKLKDFITELE